MPGWAYFREACMEQPRHMRTRVLRNKSAPTSVSCKTVNVFNNHP